MRGVPGDRHSYRDLCLPLDDYAYSGHRMLVGKARIEWQDAQYILGYFSKSDSSARQLYREFVQEGIGMGKRPELTGGGLIRSLGGWRDAKAYLKQTGREKGDERILGGSDFVEEALRVPEETLERRQQLKATGYGLDQLAREVAVLFTIEPEQIFSAGKYPLISKARSLFCYWAVRELGLTATILAGKFHLSQPAISMAVKRGENLAREGKYSLADKRKL